MPASILGFTVKDRITGFKGIAVGHVEYLTGCNQTLVVPPVDSDGKLRDGQWFDDQRLHTCLEEGPAIRLENGVTPGHDAVPSRNY